MPKLSDDVLLLLSQQNTYSFIRFRVEKNGLIGKFGPNLPRNLIRLSRQLFHC